MNETYEFETLGALRMFLNGFDNLNLDNVLPKDADTITLHWIETELTDGSTVTDVNISTRDAS